MRSLRWSFAATLLLAAAPVIAGDEVLYGPRADWVSAYDDSRIDRTSDTAIVLLDTQQRIENGSLSVFVDQAFKLSTPEALTQAGTASVVWFPDKGDLTVHSVEILRGSEIIDVLASGSKYTVLRRETQLERRHLDGSLTATLALPGLQIGDILRIAYTQTTTDQALLGEVQATAGLFAAPIEAQFARTAISWPIDQPVQWKAGPGVEGATEREDDGYRYVTLSLPLPKREDLPDSVPTRYSRPPLLQAGTFADWKHVSRVFAPLYETEGTIAPGSALSAEVEKIRETTLDPLERAALATRLVQEKVSYLFNGMSGGNYVPQSPAETWELRYGDCKAKSLLLLAVLRSVGIEADAFLVNSQVGDAVPQLLPMPGAFDHVIVRAEIDGKPYWLDGTSVGTRITNIGDTPPFRVGLPLRSTGAELQEIVARVPTVPMTEVALTLDQRGGIDIPNLLTVRARLSGALGSSLNAAISQSGEEQRKTIAESFAKSIDVDMAIFDHTTSYDDASGIAEIEVKGLITTRWKRESNRQRQIFDQLGSKDLEFNFDRARPTWRDIPVDLGPASLTLTKIHVVLPEGEEGYQLRGRPDLDQTFAGNRVARTASLDGNEFTVSERIEVLGGELPASEIAAEQAKAERIANSTPFLLAPANAARSWEYGKPELQARLAPYEEAYAAAIARDPEEVTHYLNRALFRWHTTNLAGALADYDRVIELDPTAANYLARANLHKARNEPQRALSDLRKAFEISPSSDNALQLAQSLGERGEDEEAFGLIDEYDDYGDSHEYFVQVRADSLGYAGKAEDGLAELEGLIEENPGKPELLNASCWYRARFGVGTETMIEVCNRAVERAGNPAQVLDSRALAWLRLGEFERAKADADTALAIFPNQSPTRYVLSFALRGLGDPKGEETVSYLAKVWPGLASEYARYGLEP